MHSRGTRRAGRAAQRAPIPAEAREELVAIEDGWVCLLAERTGAVNVTVAAGV